LNDPKHPPPFCPSSPSVQLCEAALSHGYLPVVFNRRSHNGTPLTTLKLQQFGDPADLREAVRYIRYRQPAGRLYAAGESTGSGLLLSYLGECGSSSYITAAACLSPIFRCQSWFEGGLPRWVQWALVLYQKTSLSRYGTRREDLLTLLVTMQGRDADATGHHAGERGC